MNQRKRRIKAANKWIYDCSVATDKFWAKRGYDRISYKGESIFASGSREYSGPPPHDVRPPTLYPKFTKIDGPREITGVCLKIRDYHPGAYSPLGQDVYLVQDVLDHD